MKIFLWTLVVVVAGGGLLFAVKTINKESPKGIAAGRYDVFAQCLKDSEAVFYGAFWCSHCQEQKKAFGDSARLLPYVECSTADMKGQTQICKDKKITGYPTWIFKDGSKLSGLVEMNELSQKTGCALPGGTATSTSSAP
ncbi:MAG: thioredoxin domain-containing protein [Candidatus Paceibacterota bacterium]|jgi:hypothetical protein